MSNKKQHDEEHSKIYKVWLWIKQWWLPIAILLITSIGLACALSIPQRVFETPREPANDKSAPVLLAQSNLRLAFLYITGGAIAVMGLIETFRKNNNEKLKNDQEKEKNDKEHERWVKAERRERYTRAVGQLGDEKAPIRMGGVYALIRLVDDWLEEKSLSDDERLKEGQVIINNLCAYIRSPFTLASRYDELSKDSPTPEGIYKDNQQEFYTDKAEFKAEADIRLGIIKEIHDRLQGPEENTPGTWSNFEYNFSRSTFFYPVDLTKSYYKKTVTLSGSTYQDRAYFRSSTYQGQADFGYSTYQDRAYFGYSTYQDRANFGGSTYRKGAYFRESTYRKGAYFRESTYQDRADFRESTYQGQADFGGSTYQGRAYFRGSTYQGQAYFRGSTYQDQADLSGSTYQWANFSGSTYQWANFRGSTYQGRADFRNSTYQDQANLSESTYQGRASFSRSTYQGRASFSGSTYQKGANFIRSIFYSETYFGKDGYSSFSRFTNYAPQFYDKKKRKNTLFGSPNNDFTVDIDKGYPIDLDSEGIPLGCDLLNPKQKNDLQDIFHEMEKVNNELLEVKDPKDKARLSKKLRSLTEELHEWREEATTVKAEDVAAEDTES